MSNSREGASGEVLSKGIETGRPAAAPDHEPLVTGRELLSYYCEFLSFLQIGADSYKQCIIVVTTCVAFIPGCQVLFDINFQSVGPMVYTMVLFQSLLFSAGFEPSHPDRRCESGTSAGCAIPWGGGTMSVSGVILIANGLSFGVSAMWGRSVFLLKDFSPHRS